MKLLMKIFSCLVLGWVLFAFTFFFPPCKFIKNAYLELKMKLIIKFEV